MFTYMDIYLVNGFLGSGKTTAIVGACKLLIQQNIKTGVITNDQGNQQVDSAYIQHLHFLHGEVANGCFCCRFNELEQVVAALILSEAPEIIFAESVGSCTDLVSTVAKPFALRDPGVRIVITVFADAYLLHSVMKGTSCFIEEAVQYIYKKQLEEADIIVINKTDLLAEDELKYVREVIEISYTGKKIICMNAYDENDILNWMRVLHEFVIPSHRASPEVDYDIYGAGEAMLAWLDQKISVHTTEPVAAKTVLFLGERIFDKITLAGYTIGHLKFFLSDEEWQKKVSYTANGIKEYSPANEAHQCRHLDVLINARVQTSPQSLKHIIENAIEETMTLTGCHVVSHQLSAFQPGYPRPVHRITI